MPAEAFLYQMNDRAASVLDLTDQAVGVLVRSEENRSSTV